jgi:hypothetical protein
MEVPFIFRHNFN